jgi:hypothetical protein
MSPLRRPASSTPSLCSRKRSSRDARRRSVFSTPLPCASAFPGARGWGVLTDVAEGTCSVLEHAYLHRVERPHGLPRPQRQERGVTSTGIVYRDLEYGTLIVELDGRLFHNTVGQRDKDFERDLDAAVEGRDTRRISWGQVFDRPCSTAGKLGQLLQVRGWQGEPHPCGPTCALQC